MKRITGILFIFIISIFLSACTTIDLGDLDKVIPPKSDSIMVKGTWEIDNYKIIEENEDSKDIIERFMNKKAEFDGAFSYIGDEACVNPKYKMKSVESSYYLLYQYKTEPEILNLGDNKEIEVISLSSFDKPFYELIKYDKDKVIFYCEGIFFYMSKLSQTTDEASFTAVKNKAKKQSKQSRDTFLKCGVLLGLKSERTYDEEDNLGESKYRTLWISASGRKLNPILEKDNLIFPRLSGIWDLHVDREYLNGYIRENLELTSVSNINKKSPKLENINVNKDYIVDINFIGNDYIAMEYFEGRLNSYSSLGKYKVLPVDNLQNDMGIKISDLEGDVGRKALISAGNNALSSTGNTSDNLEETPREDSFTMERRNGHWIMKGRINSKNLEDSQNFLDYNINIIPPRKMINYDELKVPWNDIKSKIPEAVDAYTSPNNTVALILTKNYIYLYGIKDRNLMDRPLKRIRIREGETVVMAEWALGDFTDKWEKVFKADSKEIK